MGSQQTRGALLKTRPRGKTLYRAAACRAALLVMLGASFGVWLAPRHSHGTQPRSLSRDLVRASVGSTGALTQPRTYYLVDSQQRADAVQQDWAQAVYDVGLPDLPFRDVVLLSSPADEQQFRTEMAAFDEDSATTRVQVVDLRAFHH